MKKKGLFYLTVISIVLAVVLTSLLFASADTTEKLVLTLDNPLTLQSNEGGFWIDFTPTESGMYHIYSAKIDDSYVDPYCDFYFSENESVRSDDDSPEMQFTFKLYLEKDTTYELYVGFYPCNGFITVNAEQTLSVKSGTLYSPAHKTEFIKGAPYNIYDFSGIAIEYTYGDDSVELWELDKYGVEFDGALVDFDFSRADDEGIVMISYCGIVLEYPITVVDSPIQSITPAWGSNIINTYENCIGSWQSEYNEETDEYDYWFEYEVSDIIDDAELNINYKDGTTVKANYNDEVDGYYFSYDFDSNNSGWVVGESYKATISYADVSTDIYISLLPNPVESIEVNPLSVNSPYDRAYHLEESIFDEDLGETVYYSKYDENIIFENAELIVKYTDGSTGTVSIKDGAFGCKVSLGETDQYHTPWSIGGENNINISFMGKSTTFCVQVLPNPVESIEVIEEFVNTLLEYQTGDHYSVLNEETGEEFSYFHYSVDWALENARFRVTFTNGTSEIYHIKDVVNGCGFTYEDLQGYKYGEWSEDGDNIVIIKFMGKSVEYSMPVKSHSVKSMTIVESSIPTFVENLDGEIQEAYDEKTDTYTPFFWYHPDIIHEQLLIEVELHSGETLILNLWDMIDNESFTLGTSQYDAPWTVGGTNTITVRYLNKTATANVTIIPNPIVKLEVVEGTVPEIIECTNGRWEYRETENGSEQFFYYEISHIFRDAKIKITYIDGEEKIFSADEVVEPPYCFDIDSDQYSEPWSVGGNNTVTIRYKGAECTYKVTITESPVVKIEVDGTSVPTLYEGIGGYECEKYDENKEFIGYYYCYNTEIIRENLKITVYFSDDTSKELSFYDTYMGMDFTYEDYQYEKPWTVGGENCFVVSFAGKTATVSVRIAENPIERIEVVEGTVKPIIENTNGYYEYRYDKELDKEVEFFYYNCYEALDGIKFTVYFKDGDEIIVAPDSLDYITDQYDTPWIVGGNNIARCSFMIPEFTSVTVDVNIEIIPSPVKSIEVVDGTVGYLYENSMGYMEYCYDDMGNPQEYFYYYYDRIVENMYIKVTFTDDTYETYSISDWVFDVSFDIREYQEQDHWEVGINSLTVSLMGASVDVPFEIKRSPVKSIELLSGKVQPLLEKDNGYFENFYNGEENDSPAFIYSIISIREQMKIKVNFIDGTAKILSQYDDYNGIYFELDHNQYDTPWTVGGENIVTFSFMGFEADYNVTIIPSRIAGIELVTDTVIPLIENCNGYFEKSWDDELEEDVEFYYYPEIIPFENAYVKILFTDGNYELVKFTDEFEGGYIHVESDQWDNPWGIGQDNKVWIVYKGHYTAYDVEIIEPTVKSITVDSSKLGDLIIYDFDNGYYVEDAFILYVEPGELIFTVEYVNGETATYRWDDVVKDGYFEGYPISTFGKEPAVIGENTMYFEYMNITVPFTVNVIAPTVDYISVIKNPNKTSYEFNSDYTFEANMEGLDVEIFYSNGTTKKLSDITTKIEYDYDDNGLVYYYGTDDGIFYIFTEYIEGEPIHMAYYKGAQCQIEAIEYTPGKEIVEIQVVDFGENGKGHKLKVMYADDTYIILEAESLIHVDNISNEPVSGGVARTELGCYMYMCGLKENTTAYFYALGKEVSYILSTEEENAGDSNGDGIIAVDDAVHLLYSITFGEEKYELFVDCDFNYDGSIDYYDAVYLLYYVMFGEDYYPLATA